MTSNPNDHYQIRSWHAFSQEITRYEGVVQEKPLIKAVAAVVIANPFAGKPFQQDLSSLTKYSHLLGAELGKRAVALLGGLPVESYGKGGIAGLAGSQEHLVACVTTVFGDAFRNAIGGGRAWISSTSKLAAAGASLDVPLAFKDEVYVRAYYDTITLTVPDGPQPDELLICAAVASGPRPNQRVGGMTREEAIAQLK
jgi:hypothetical protein